MTKYKRKRNINVSASLREIVFGMEDGMVSTLGAITGIAIGSQDHFTVILAGIVIISVEAISMGMGSYISNQSGQEFDQRRLLEEKTELAEFPKEEKRGLFHLFVRDGWSKNLAQQMADEASDNENLMFTEMTYRDLKMSVETPVSSLKLGLYMFFSYVAGGMIPLFAYLILPISLALKISVLITLVGLFGLGVTTSRYTKTSLIKSGLRVLFVGGVALTIGLLVGKIAILIK